ncbi:MAG TPA: RluA family pseudouridine synthase [Verrucomicrobiae bacterium]
MSAVIKLSSQSTKEFWEIPILFEDEHLLALDKPSRLLSSPDRYDPARPNLMRLLHEGIKAGKPWARERGLSYLANAHRLDFETSGVMLLAKSKPVLVALADQFGTNQPRKTYLALVQHAPAEATFTVDAPLSAHPFQPGVVRVDLQHGKKSRTDFEVVEKFDGWAWLKCRPLTGRTHQIRVHLRHARHTIVADEVYGGKPLWLSRLKRDYRLKPGREERPLLNRVALHAAELTITHPITGASVTIESPLPKEFRVALKYLRQFAAA